MRGRSSTRFGPRAIWATLEDEFAGLFKRHDSLAGPRLHAMFFNPASDLSKVFSEDKDQWLANIPNRELGQLIYVILSWKDQVEHPPLTFESLIEKDISNPSSSEKNKRQRLEELRAWHREFQGAEMFYPFMSDVVGNTICADILDYLARDRVNLGMESRRHLRLQRYFTIRPGTLQKPTEGLRLSVLVTRQGRGGQRRDVATAVLEVMRERYEMAERVFYHHKKAAASAMLAKLLELVPTARKPRDDDSVYPAPWEDTDKEWDRRVVPHMTHLSDSQLIQYLAAEKCDEANKTLQRRIARGLLYRRTGQKAGMYRTLLVVDEDLVQASPYTLSVFTEELRTKKDEPSSEGRIRLEVMLAEAARVNHGEVIVYCPSEKMQAKEIDVRLEVKEGSVLPLRELAARHEFVDLADVDALRKHYEQLWRAYIFVSPQVFENKGQCDAIIDKFCNEYGIPRRDANKKARGHRFGDTKEGVLEREGSPADTKDISAHDLPAVAVEESKAPEWTNNEILVESRSNLLKFARRKTLSNEQRDALWNDHLKEDRVAGERTRPGVVTEKEWADLERRHREPGLYEDE
jgi:HD superfamily phosphohydrolase